MAVGPREYGLEPILKTTIRQSLPFEKGEV